MEGLKVGITGGIGSGKTTVCRIFEVLGIPVFYADDRAKALMNDNQDLMATLKHTFGNELYSEGELNRQLLAKKVFNDPAALRELNQLVHPATKRDYHQWLQKQNTAYTLKEAALFFETGINKDMNILIGVSAPQNLRIERVKSRSGLTETEIMARIQQQMDEDEKMSRCHLVLINDDLQALLPQVLNLHQYLLRQATLMRNES
ncbi:MAG: dephospho-CoA kinase [Bacteroidetes bacterium]|nr:dephospho-CoA kinase [Bacteroidota bacterium]